MKIIYLKPLKNHPHLYQFNLSVEGLIINGFVYNSKNKAILAPKNDKGYRIVRGWGMTWKNMQEKLDKKMKWAKKGENVNT